MDAVSSWGTDPPGQAVAPPRTAAMDRTGCRLARALRRGWVGPALLAGTTERVHLRRLDLLASEVADARLRCWHVATRPPRPSPRPCPSMSRVPPCVRANGPSCNRRAFCSRSRVERRHRLGFASMGDGIAGKAAIPSRTVTCRGAISESLSLLLFCPSILRRKQSKDG